MLSTLSVCLAIFELSIALTSGAVEYDSNFSICCIKDDWEGLMFAEEFLYQGPQFVTIVNASVHVAFSVSRQKLLLNISGVIDPTEPTPCNVIYLYDYQSVIYGIFSITNEEIPQIVSENSRATLLLQNTSYYVENGKCDIYQIEGTLRKQCIPNNADVLSTGTFGEEGRQLTTYRFNITYYMLWTATAAVIQKDLWTPDSRECEPVYVAYTPPTITKEEGMLYAFYLMDVVPISPNVFDVPKACSGLK